MNSEFGILYLIPCPISDETAPWEVLPAANRAVMDSLDYFIVENTRSARRLLALVTKKLQPPNDREVPAVGTWPSCSAA